MQERQTLAVVVPAYNEGEGLRDFHARLAPVLDALPDLGSRVLYVDDGSRDETWAVIESLAATDPRVDGIPSTKGHCDRKAHPGRRHP